MGAGPKLVDFATRYADGLSGASPIGWANPAKTAEVVKSVHEKVAGYDRDPAGFGVGIMCTCLVHEDENVIDRALDTPLIRWLAGVFGRINPSDWAEEGLESPVPEGWAYHTRLMPQTTPQSFIDDVLSKTTRKHVEAGFLIGTPTEIAAKLRAFADSGITWLTAWDLLGPVLEPEDAALATTRTIEMCKTFKAGVPV